MEVSGLEAQNRINNAVGGLLFEEATSDSVFDSLQRATGSERDHGRAAGLRFNHRHAKILLTGIDHRTRALQVMTHFFECWDTGGEILFRDACAGQT